MRRTSCYGFSMVLTLLFWVHGSLAAASEASGEWREIGKAANETVTIYKKEVPGSDLLAYKAEGVLAAPIDRLVTVVADTARRKEWAERVEHAEVLEEISPTERIEYTHGRTPWPLKDRDFVYFVKLTLDAEKRSVHFQMRSVDHPKRPPGDKVRGEIHDSSFTLTYAGPDRTHMAAVVYADPKGAIPKWIVNLVQKRMPEKALRGLLKQVRKPGIEGHPLVREWMR